MKKNKLIFVLIFVLIISINAKQTNINKIGQCSAFFKGGNMATGIINFLKTSQMKIGFINQGKFSLQKVWMLNFANTKWGFPNERKVLNQNFDTIFLKNGRTFYDKVKKYSFGFKVFRFANTKDIHISKIKRIYFCCTKLPKAYKAIKNDDNQLAYTTFFSDGRVKNSRIKYYNINKTGFEDGLQVNTKDIVMINFENEKNNFPNEKKHLNYKLDTVFINNGKYIQRAISILNFEKGKIVFQDESEVDMNKVTRIYFNRYTKKNYHRRNDTRGKLIRKNYPSKGTKFPGYNYKRSK